MLLYIKISLIITGIVAIPSMSSSNRDHIHPNSISNSTSNKVTVRLQVMTLKNQV